MTEKGIDLPGGRRRFLAALAAAGVLPRDGLRAALAVTGPQDGAPTQPGPPPGVDAAAIEGALRLLGLDFDAEEKKGLLSDLAGDVLTWRQAPQLPNELAPCLGAVQPAAPLGAQPRPATASRLAEAPAPDGELGDADLAYLPARSQARLIREGRVSSERLTRLAIARLKRFDESLHCCVTLLEERAIEQARRADADLKSKGPASPLHGVPWGVKDLFAVSGARTTWGAKPFADQIIDDTAEVVRRLDAAGCVLIAKLSCGALAMGDVWFGGRTRCPWNPELGSSGSSAGSAAAVAAGIVPFAIGTETLGSIVSPSTRCGVTGLRPTFGSVPRSGAMALCWSLDKVGPIARDVGDCMAVFDIIAGPDGRDLDCRDLPPRAASSGGIRLGSVAGAFARGNARDRDVLEGLAELGYEAKAIELPRADRRLRLILDVEAAAAFDDFTRDGRVRQLTEQGPGSWPRSFRAARFVPAVDYVQAARLRTRLRQEMAAVMADIDVFVVPSFSANVLLITNFTGHPCLVLPNGFNDRGLPSSISFIGRLGGEAELAIVAAAWQEASGHHRRRPPLFG